MRASGDHATAEQERLTLYLLGAMDDAERESFEEHLASCWRCLNEATEIGPTLAGLAGLDDADWSSAVEPPTVASSPDAQALSSSDVQAPASADTQAPPRAETQAPSPAEAQASSPSASTASGNALDVPSPASGDPATRESSGSDVRRKLFRLTGARPGGARPSGTRPASTRTGPRRRRRAILAGAAAIVALALVGGVVTVNAWNAGHDRVLTASGEAPGYGASLSVAIVVGDEGRSTIRITVTGLRPGIRYRLYAVTKDGTTHVVRDWTASSGPHEVAGETSLPVDELSFITVGLPNGSAIVTAPIVQNS